MRPMRRGRGGYRGAGPSSFFPYMAAIPMPYFYRGGSRGRAFRCVFVGFFFFTHPSHFTICVWFLAISSSSVQLMHCHLQGKGKKQLVCPLLTEHI